MFHWICPECGREIAPTVRECPACDPSAVVVEPAQVGVVEAPTARLVSRVGIDAPAARLINNAGTVANASAPTARLPDPPVPLAKTLNTEERTEPAPVEWRRTAVAASEADDALPQFGDSPAWNSDPLAALSAMLDPPAAVPEPPRSLQRLPMAVHAAPPALRALIAELRAAAQPPRNPAGEIRSSKRQPEPRVAIEKGPLPPRPARPALRPMGAALIALSFSAGRPAGSDRPVAPRTPYAGPAPAMAPLANYSPLEGRPMRPAVPARDVCKKECGPRVNLPGLMLTPPLIRFADRELNPIPSAALALVTKRLVPRWFVSVLIAGTILVAGFNTVFSIVPRSASAAKPGAGSAGTLAAAGSRPIPGSPLAKALEVTGFRIQMDPAKKSEIQYLVVNHTANRIAGVTVYVELRAADAPAGQPPLGRFQFAAPNLGAFESKEMSSAIERVTRAITLPDWRDLRADVEVGL